MNVIAITGNMCKEPTLSYTKNNKSVLENTLAVNKGIKNDDGTYDVDFINFVCFEKKADYLKNYAKKGSKLEITGKLRTDNWKDEEGKSHNKVYVVADAVKILSSISKSNEEESKDIPVDDLSIKTEFDAGQQITIDDEDLPF